MNLNNNNYYYYFVFKLTIQLNFLFFLEKKKSKYLAKGGDVKGIRSGGFMQSIKKNVEGGEGGEHYYDNGEK